MPSPLRFSLGKRPDLQAMLAKTGLDEKGVDTVIAEAALEVERLAKLDAPVDTGRLRSSGHTFKERDGVHGVAFDVEYAAFPEFGTGRLGAATDPGPTPADYTHGPSPGQEAKPFLRPALARVGAQLRSMFQRR